MNIKDYMVKLWEKSEEEREFFEKLWEDMQEIGTFFKIDEGEIEEDPETIG